MTRGRAHSPEVKAAVVAALLAGQEPDALAAEHRLPLSTVLTWQHQARRVREVQPEKKAELGALIGDYLTEVLTTLLAQARHARDPDWLAKQDGADLAVLHGVLTDKAIRILSALQPDGDASPTGDGA